MTVVFVTWNAVASVTVNVVVVALMMKNVVALMMKKVAQMKVALMMKNTNPAKPVGTHVSVDGGIVMDDS